MLIQNYLEIRFEIAGLAREYGDHLLDNHAVHDERIDTGTCGELLFLMELYQQSKDEKYIESIDRTISQLLAWCKKNPSNNFALYTGRAGVVYVLMQRYAMGGYDKLLRECLELIAPANGEYLHNPYTSDDLYNGRAGTLLVLVQLYWLSHENFLPGYIQQFLTKIIANAQWTADGICWQSKEEVNLKASCGFAHGTAGIKYVLNQVDRWGHDPVIRDLVQAIDRYTNTCWADSYQNRIDYRTPIANKEQLFAYKEACSKKEVAIFTPKDDCSWAHGTMGILVTDLNNKQGKTKDVIAEKLKGLVNGCSFAGDHLYDGYAGLGLCLLEANRQRDEEELQKITFRVLYQLTSGAFAINTDGGLMHGDLGSIYFLLKSIQAGERRENILLPFLHGPFIGQPSTIPVKASLPETRKAFIAACFPRTSAFVETIDREAFVAFLERMEQPDCLQEPVAFAAFIEQWLQKPARPSELLPDLYRLEQERHKFLQADKRSSFEVYIEGLLYLDEIMGSLNKPDSWLLEQMVAISPTIKIVQSAWDWSKAYEVPPSEDKLTRVKQAQNLRLPPKCYRYIFQVGGKREVVETRLRSDAFLIISRFMEPKKVKQGIESIQQYVRSMSPNELEKLLVELGYTDMLNHEEFLQLIDRTVLGYIKQFIYRKILVIS